MPDFGIAMFMPTRSRPTKAREAYDSAIGDPRVIVVPVLDARDPAFDEYAKVFIHGAGISVMAHVGGMVERTNFCVARWMEGPFSRATVIGWMADDTIFRQADWAHRVLLHFIRDDALILTVNDGHMDKERPQSAVFIRSDAVRALGYLALPSQNHLFIDDVWRELRDGIGERYGHHDSDILAEHMHPYIGKAEWDQQYLDIHKEERYVPDRMAFEQWRSEGGLDEDIKKVLSCVK